MSKKVTNIENGLPSGWKTSKLETLLKVQNGYAFDAKQFNDKSGFPLIRIRDLREGKSNTYYNGDYKKEFVVKKGDFLIGMDGEFNCFEWKGENALLNQRVCRLVDFQKNTFPKYIFWGINKYLKEIEDSTSFVTVKHISSKQILNISIPLPTFDEQNRIVDVLEKTFSKIDKSIALVKENIDKIKQLNASVLDEVFDKLLKKNKTIPLGSLDNITAGGTPLRSEQEYWNGDIDWFTSGELNQKYTLASKEKITQLGLEKSNCKIFPKGTLLIGMYDTAAFKMSILSNAGSCNQAIVGIRPNSNLFDSIYLLHQLTFLRPKVMELRQGVRQQNLNSTKIKELRIYLPKLSEQRKIATFIETIQKRNEKLLEYYQSKLLSLQELKNSVLESAFRGELRKGAKENIKAKVIAMPTKQRTAKSEAFLRKVMLGAYLVNNFYMEREFGHVKFMKLLYLCEQVSEMDLLTNYQKASAGPFDKGTLVNIEKYFVEKNWFIVNKEPYTLPNGTQRERTYYTLTEKSNEYLKYYPSYFENQLDRIENLTKIFSKSNSKKCEIVATVYYAYKELTKQGKIVNDTTLIKGFFDFHPDKGKNFKPEDVERELPFIYSNGIINL